MSDPYRIFLSSYVCSGMSLVLAAMEIGIIAPGTPYGFGGFFLIFLSLRKFCYKLGYDHAPLPPLYESCGLFVYFQ
jgi:hypothetical protein